MSAFSQQSLERLTTCHPDLVRLFQDVVRGYDCTIEAGARFIADEQAAIASGRSTLTNPWDSKHVVDPTDPTKRQVSDAVDAAPFPVVWPDRELMTDTQYLTAVIRFAHLAGYVKARAETLGIGIRWGGAWSGQVNPAGAFQDLDHFERTGPA